VRIQGAQVQSVAEDPRASFVDALQQHAHAFCFLTMMDQYAFDCDIAGPLRDKSGGSDRFVACVASVAVNTPAFRPGWVLWCFIGPVLTTPVDLRPLTGVRSGQRLRRIAESDSGIGSHPARLRSSSGT
jgi:hypothetical protein